MPYAAPVYQWDEKSGKQRIFSMMFPKWTYPSGEFKAFPDHESTGFVLQPKARNRPA